MRTRIILAAAEEINFRGFKFTMNDLTKKLGISKTSLYEHFSSKNELITTLIEMALEDIRKQEEAIYNNSELPIEQKFRSLVTVSPKLFGPISDRIYDDLQKDYPDIWNDVATFRQERLDGLISLLEQGMNLDAIRPINFKILRQVVLGAMNDLFHYRFLAESNMTYSDSVTALADIIIYGLIPRNNYRE